MPEFVLNRNHTLRSLTGHTVTFAKGTPTFVPQSLIREVVAIGAERVDAAQDEGMHDEKKTFVEPQGQERIDLLYACFDGLVATNARNDFTAQGAPHIKAIEREVGFKIDNKERDAVWADYKAAKAGQ